MVMIELLYQAETILQSIHMRYVHFRYEMELSLFQYNSKNLPVDT